MPETAKANKTTRRNLGMVAPSHKIITDENDMVLLKLGASADDEADGQPSAAADGDGADEDGIDLSNTMFVTGQPTDLTFDVMNMTGVDAKLTGLHRLEQRRSV